MWSSWCGSVAQPGRMEPSFWRAHFRNQNPPNGNWQWSLESRMITKPVRWAVSFLRIFLMEDCSDGSRFVRIPESAVGCSLHLSLDVCVPYCREYGSAGRDDRPKKACQLEDHPREN